MGFSTQANQMLIFIPESVKFTQVIITLLVASILLLVYIFLKYAFRRYSYSKYYPGKPLGFFNILGNISEMQMKEDTNYNAAFLELMGEYSKHFKKLPFFCFWVSYSPSLTIIKAEALEELLAGSKAAKKGWFYNFIHPWLGTGLLTSFGKKWKSRRKLLTPSFHFDILKEFLPIFDEQAKILINILQKETINDFTDIVKPITLCTLDIICETTLGVSIGAQKNKDSEYVKAVIRASDIISERMTNCMYWLDLIFRFTKVGRQSYADIKRLHDFTQSVIQEKKQKLLSGDTNAFKKKRKALMDVLLEHHVQTKELSEEDIREEVDTFTFAGHDTTSMGISWALYLIGLNKDVQENIHEELDRIFGSDTERPVNTDDLKDMNYLERVLKESQRIYPSAPSIARETTEEMTIGGYNIPKGSQCTALIYYLHRDEAVFPDPEKFDPERFLPENSANRHPFAYIPFSAGPRNCIGQRFAIMEEKVIISHILRNFTIESLDQRDKHKPALELILRPTIPIRIKIRHRKFS